MTKDNSNNANTAIPVTLPTDQYYEDEVECRSGCPVRTDARGYLLAATEGDYQLAYAISRATNPFASICGKVCGAPCETACRRGDVDEPVSIRNMKGFLTEKHGPESGDLKTPLSFATVLGSPTPEANGKTVGIIGGGCAGYTCAHDLARLGYQCTVYERHSISGGMLNQGVPVNRLDRHVIQAEIDSICALGLIEVVHNCDVGKTIGFDEIRNKHDAVFIGVGLAVGKSIPMPNSEHKDVHAGLGFLLDFNFGRVWDLSGKRTIVIGGGDVAYDVARSALRSAAPEVQMVCLERDALGEMPGSKDERDGGRREGVVLNDGWGPDEIVLEDGQFRGLRIKKVVSVFDEERRFAPAFDDSEKRFIEGDILFFAVGQGSDLAFLEGSDIKVTRGIIDADPNTGATNVQGVFAAGDIAHGAKLFIDAIEGASKAALGIHAFLSSDSLMKKTRQLGWEDLDDYERDSRYVDLEREDRQELEPDLVHAPNKNTTLEYEDAVAQDQGTRCLACHIHPTFEGNICILCGGCVDVCPSYCLKMVHISRIQGDASVKDLVVGEFAGEVDAATDGSAMLFDPLKCIRCGMCAIKCPTGACKMSVNDFKDCYTQSSQRVEFS
jgi:formate dehydrogenase (NADP+) beta subunit